MITVALLWWCKICNVAHYSNISKGINMKLGKLTCHDKGHNSESNIFGVMRLFA
jgi:hypothetical protein